MSLERVGAATLLAGAVLLTGCLSPPPGPDGRVDPDPYERSNRAVFAFNEQVDRWVLDPIAEGWALVTPRFFRVGVDKMLTNLRFPVRFLTTLGQGEPVAAGEELARFVVNSSVGIAGFFDPASRIGLRFYDEDFGQMFGRWGFGPGPYWVLPFLGPSNPRDAWGYLFDSATNVVPGAGVVALINGRAIADPQVDLARVAALDLYVFVRDGYLQRREMLVRNLDREGMVAVAEERGEGAPDDDLYEIDDALYEDDEALAEEAAAPAEGEAVLEEGGGLPEGEGESFGGGSAAPESGDAERAPAGADEAAEGAAAREGAPAPPGGSSRDGGAEAGEAPAGGTGAPAEAEGDLDAGSRVGDTDDDRAAGEHAPAGAAPGTAAGAEAQ